MGSAKRKPEWDLWGNERPWSSKCQAAEYEEPENDGRNNDGTKGLHRETWRWKNKGNQNGYGWRYRMRIICYHCGCAVGRNWKMINQGS